LIRAPRRGHCRDDAHDMLDYLGLFERLLADAGLPQ
jgi:hypothetical protein